MNTAFFHHAHLDAAQQATALKKRHGELVRQTQKWVAQTFYGTMLKKMREFPFKSDMMDGGRGGQMFHELLDQRLADHMSRGAAPQLVDSIVQKIERGQATASYLKHSQKSAAEIKSEVSPLNSSETPMLGRDDHVSSVG
jgi:Rod binding domain-containing protein